jgi:hypothetical protein
LHFGGMNASGRPPINPFMPTTLPYDPMGARQVGGRCPGGCLPCHNGVGCCENDGGYTTPCAQGARQVVSGRCPGGCLPCHNGVGCCENDGGYTTPCAQGARQYRQSLEGCNPPCNPGEVCIGNDCIPGDPARQNVITRCDSYNPSCPGPVTEANYNPGTRQCCGNGGAKRRRR